MTSQDIKPTNRVLLATIARRAMIERGLEPDFPAAAQHEMQAISAPAISSKGVRDMRDLLWASIDNDDSRDLDQLTVAEQLPGGRVRILVAIADVDGLVHQGTALDGHAARNTTSVYTPAAIFPMLPEMLSTNLTSLNEDEDRVSLVADLVVETDGSFSSSSIYRALVRNRAKLAYRSVAAWLDGSALAPSRVEDIPGLADNLRLQYKIAQQLVELRRLEGSLSLETLEARVVFQGEAITDLELDRKNRAKQLIEAFMIAANGATARFLQSKQFPSLRRVLKSPERWERIVRLAADLGDRLPMEPDSAALENFLQRRRKAWPDTYPDLSMAVVKLIGKGEYALDLPGDESPGHFGLAVKDYTHSTAPNRRFPDLITQRLVKAALEGTPQPYSNLELSQLAKRCTEKEGDAAKVERLVKKSAAALLLAGRIGANFDAIVTGASDKGTWVRIFQPPIEGRLDRGFQGLDVGDRVQVKLIRTDVERGFIDFARC